MPKPRYTSYIICTSPRSGSTLLCTLLQATGVAGNPDSHFHSKSLEGWLLTYGLRERFSSSQQAVRSVVTRAIQTGKGDTEIFGLRMQRTSFVHFLQQIGSLDPEMGCDLDRIQAVFGSTLFIHLTRSNKLEQAISLVRATQTGLWHRAADGSELERLTDPKPPNYDSQEIQRALSELEKMDRDWLCWFEKEGVSPLRFTYDQVSQNPTAVLVQILQSLGVETQAAQHVSPPTAKLADALNQQWAEQFRAQHPALFQP